MDGWNLEQFSVPVIVEDTQAIAARMAYEAAQRVRAARRVQQMARDEADAAMLLEALGLDLPVVER